MFYTSFASASKNHIDWLRKKLFEYVGITGPISKSRSESVYQLRYAKRESVVILKRMYYTKNAICLQRKRLKIKKALAIISKHLK